MSMLTRTKMSGRTGVYAKSLARKEYARSAGHRSLSLVYAAAAAAAVALRLAWNPASGVSWWAVAGASTALGYGAVVQGRKAAVASSKAGKARIGARSEARVARMLARRSGVRIVMNGVHPGGSKGDVDHLLLGPCLAVVETKTGTGKVSYAYGKMRAGRRVIPGDPVQQARRQADRVSRLTGRRCAAVVCVPDMTNQSFRASGVPVCSLQELPEVVRGLPGVFSNGRDAAAAAKDVTASP